MKVGLTGGSGLIGHALAAALQAQGHEVLRFVRRPARDAGEVSWAPAEGRVDATALTRLDAIVNLAGENIGQRWTPQAKERIRQSRVLAAATLAGALARQTDRPRVLVQASAVGYYGDRGDEVLSEEAEPGTGFLAEVCRLWEAAAAPAATAGHVVSMARLGLVLAPRAGALARMLTPFRLGLGGPLGGGRQWVSWIHLEDAVAALIRLLGGGLPGPVNVVAPVAARQAELAQALGAALRRPALMPAPAFALRLVLGEMGRELLLQGARVWPRRLLDAGFEFQYPTLPLALAACVGARP